MKKEELGNTSEKRKLSRKQKILISSIAILTGFSGTVVGTTIIAYNALFPRFERPDYTLKAGNYCYERVQDSLHREELYFPSKSEKLKGYYYPAESSKGLVVVAHGYHAGADDYIPLIAYMVGCNYSVFTYDVTGTYDSEGDGQVGWCQSLIDLDYALQYVEKTEPYSGQPLFLIGHSWGGYAATSVLSLHKNVRACAGIAPMNNAPMIMVEKGQQYVGKLADTAKPILTAYQKLLFKNYVKYNGVLGINSVDIPVLIAQGVDDKVITYDGQSVMARKEEITNPNVRYYEGYGLQGDHDNIWHSVRSAVYQQEVESQLKKLQKEKGEKLTDDEKREFYKSVDHALYSEVNEELMQQIVAMFDQTYKR